MTSNIREKNASSSEGLRVCLRVRPPIASEVQEETAVHVPSSNQVVIRTDKHHTKHSYDFVFNEVAKQEDIFNFVQPILLDIVKGINGCIFAYGQTSSGKSYTMIGPDGGRDIQYVPREMWGLIPRSADYLLEKLNNMADKGNINYEVKASFLQLYNENVYDLLKSDHNLLQERGTSLKIREMMHSNSHHTDVQEIYVSGLSEYRVQTAEDILQIISVGCTNRTTRSTSMNITSSRSHAILQLSFEIEATEKSKQNIITKSRLNLIDLAGSEKMDVLLDDPSKRHVQELTSINKSLSALGNVISALSLESRIHIPYRDSKLTRLLQDSLGGNSRTILIACICPTKSNTHESTNTLLFANRAKNVTQRVKANVVINDKTMLIRAQQEIKRLQLLLQDALQVNASNQSISSLGDKEVIERLKQEKEDLLRSNQDLSLRLRQYENTTSTSLNSPLRDSPIKREDNLPSIQSHNNIHVPIQLSPHEMQLISQWKAKSRVKRQESKETSTYRHIEHDNVLGKYEVKLPRRLQKFIDKGSKQTEPEAIQGMSYKNKSNEYIRVKGSMSSHISQLSPSKSITNSNSGNQLTIDDLLYSTSPSDRMADTLYHRLQNIGSLVDSKVDDVPSNDNDNDNSDSDIMSIIKKYKANANSNPISNLPKKKPMVILDDYEDMFTMNRDMVNSSTEEFYQMFANDSPIRRNTTKPKWDDSTIVQQSSKVLCFTKEDIGNIIEMYNYFSNSWDKVKILEYDSINKIHRCEFIDGSQESFDLINKPIRAL